MTVIHVFITSTLCHIARNYVHRESLDCLIILIQTLFLLLHIQAVLDKRQAMVVEGAQPKRKLARDLEIEMGEDYYMDMREHWDLAKVTRNMIFYQRFTLERMWLTSLIQIL